MTPLPRPWHRPLVVPSVAVLALSALAACSSSPTDDGGSAAREQRTGAPAASVELAPSGIPDQPLKVGVLVSPSSPPGQGSDLAAGAVGAKVAAYRLGLGGADVQLVVVDDHGTSQGARQAVRRFADEKVAGIAALTTGSHLDRALDAASEAGLPVLLPYYRLPDDQVPSGVWMTGPDLPATTAALEKALHDAGVRRPLLLAADGVPTGAIEPAERRVVGDAGADAAVAAVTRAVKENRVDGVLVAASAATQADVVSRLQGQVPDVPVALTPEALSADFGTDLSEQGGTAAGQLFTAGPDATDTTTLANGPAADRAASYFSALRLAAGDQKLTDLFGDTSFASVATPADIPSHDAVVAIAAAAGKAGSTAPADVETALQGLTVDGTDGLAGPALDFSDPSALPGDSVVPLLSTSQDPGVRPAGRDPSGPSLFWFAGG